MRQRNNNRICAATALPHERSAEEELLPLATGKRRPGSATLFAVRRTSKRTVAYVLAFVSLFFYSFWHCTNEEFVTPDKISQWSANKTIVITGANSVVAYGALVQLVRANTADHIIMACRSSERCQETLDQVQKEAGVQQRQYTKISTVSLDLTSRASIQQCAESVRSITRQQHQPTAAPTRPNHKKKIILVWNANDSVHDPIQVNGWGHLYLTHLLYPQLQRIVVAASIVGGLPWNVVQPWNQSAPYYPTWFQPAARYGTNKRAILFLAQQLLEGQYHRDKQHQPLQVIATQAGLTCDETDACSVFSMTPQRGGFSHLRAMLDPNLKPGAYLGHRWVLWGKTIVAGSLSSSWYHMHLSEKTRTQLWQWSLRELGIQDFGRPV